VSSERTRTRSEHLWPGDVDVDTDRRKRRKVRRLKGVEVLRRELDCSISSEKLVVEEEADLGNVVVTGDNEGGLQWDEAARSEEEEGESRSYLRGKERTRMLSTASVKSSERGICAPVRMTVLLHRGRCQEGERCRRAMKGDEPKILEQERECRRGEGHGVGTVKNDERIPVSVTEKMV
jgi:hypothetical protein